MSVRFRIRTSQGQEISFASHEMFVEFVRSGDLSPEDVVYDAETKEWSSALTHPVVLQIEMDSEDDPERSEEPKAEASRTSAAAAEEAEVAVEPRGDAPTVADIGLELAPQAEQLSPEEAGAAFVKKMEAERASEFELDEEPALQGFTMEQGSSSFAADVVEEPPPAPPPPPSRPERREEPRPPAPSRKKAKAKAKPAKRKKSGTGRKYAPLVIVAAVVVAGGVYFGPELLAPEADDGTDMGVDSSPAPVAAPVVAEGVLREAAQERFLATTRALLRDLPPIPDTWLHGAYLAAPSEYPQVREVWSQYLATIQQARAGDNERYRAGYLRALDDAGVEGSDRTLRMAGAVAAFQGEVGARAAHYDRAEALATAALRGHDALAEVEGTIAYEPGSVSPVSENRVIEAVGRNPDAQSFLDKVLENFLTELDGPDGPGQTANVGEWIWDGLLDAVAN